MPLSITGRHLQRAHTQHIETIPVYMMTSQKRSQWGLVGSQEHVSPAEIDIASNIKIGMPQITTQRQYIIQMFSCSLHKYERMAVRLTWVPHLYEVFWMERFVATWAQYICAVLNGPWLSALYQWVFGARVPTYIAHPPTLSALNNIRIAHCLENSYFGAKHWMQSLLHHVKCDLPFAFSLRFVLIFQDSRIIAHTTVPENESGTTTLKFNSP